MFFFRPSRLILFLGVLWATTSHATPWCHNPDVMHWMHQTLHPSSTLKRQICHAFSQAQCNQRIIAQYHHPYEHKPWSDYKKQFVTPKRIEQGKFYLQQHHKTFEQASKRYHVPPSVIAAILGIETNYGNNIGQDSAMEALLTLGFCQDKRAMFFRQELVALVHLSQMAHIPLTSIKSSYAGALGIPQFMPSNYQMFGTMYHKKAGLDLFRHHGDAIMSTGHFLAQHGWLADGPIYRPYHIKHHATTLRYHPSLLARPKPIRSDQILGIYRPDSYESYSIYPNFQILMHYNHSAQYALAVALLAQAIKSPGLHRHV